MYSTIEEHQAVLVELWKELDRICRSNGIRYQLFAGTALGLVRHSGIIPWDDDLDVVMLRDDYERFLHIAPEQLDTEKYFLQAEYSEHYHMFFSKLRKNGTAFMERYIPKDTLVHQGIYIDLFPCDALSDKPLIAKLQFAASKLVIASSLGKRGYQTRSVFKKLLISLCRWLPQKPLCSFVMHRGAHETTRVHTFFGGAHSYQKNVFPRAWLTETTEMSFCGEAAPVSAHYDALLTRLYGDYMTPLSEEERKCKVHAEIVDVYHPYTMYLEQQRNQSFASYSRSIR